MSEDTLDIVQMHAMYDDIKVYERLHSATSRRRYFCPVAKTLKKPKRTSKLNSPRRQSS